MNLGDLLDFVGNLLDYDPSNPTYREQLVSLLNDAQTRCLTDRPWSFASSERKLQVFTDTTLSLTFVLNAADATGAGLSFGTTVKPGSTLDGAKLTFTDSAGVEHIHHVRWVENATTLYLDRLYEGATGTYTATVQRREVYLPSDCMTVQNVGDPHVGTIPAKALFLSKWEREDANLDPSLLGTIEAYLPSEGRRVAAPQAPRGVATVAAVGQGARTINVYMVNVLGPNAQNYPTYRDAVSSGFESALSKVATFSLTDTQTLEFTPETISNTTGLYRRYYFTCPEAGILAPVRVRSLSGVDTIPPTGGVTIASNLALSHLEGQAFHSEAVRYQYNQSAVYQSLELYPHPSADQDLNVRMVVAPTRMQEDQDVPLVPAAYAQMVAYAALENITLKVANPALSQVYQRKKALLYKAMEQRYLKEVPRRIIKGTPTAGYRFVRNPYGKLTFTP
jgi:hypothetical protein